jgi:YD repeat-containing protein
LLLPLRQSDPTGTYGFSYDNMGRLIGTSASYSFLTSRTFTNAYTYDAASNRTGFTDPENGATSYVYDTLNRLETLTPPTAYGSGSWGVGQIACRIGQGGGGSGGGGGPGKQGTFWKSLKNYRQNIKTDGERYYQWDYTHGDVEVYNSRGQHLGSADAQTGQMIKPAVPGRVLDL